MRANRVRSGLAALGLVLGLGTATLAQEQQGSAEIGVQAKPTITADDQLRQAEAIQKRGAQLVARMIKLLDEARRDKDIIRANCLNRKLTEANATNRSIEQRAKALKDAAATNDDGRRGHEFTVLSVLGQKMDSLEQEAAQCLGQSMYEPGQSQVTTTIPPDTWLLDPTLVPPDLPAPPSVTVPPPLSPAR